jgi:chromosome partitioning protein
LWLAPANPGLAGADVELVPMLAREFRLKRALEGVRGAYDIVLIDCPPSLGLLTVNALAAADEVIVPVQCEYLALEGLGQLTQTLELVRRNLNPSLRLRGLLLTMFDSRTNLSQQVADEVRSHFANTFKTVIPRSVRLSEAPSHGLPIARYDPSSRANRAYDELADELIAGSRTEVHA